MGHIMNTKSLIILFSCFAFSSGFAANWQGQNIQNVISRYGEPNAVVNTGDGNKVYFYYQKNPELNAMGYAGGVTVTTYKGRAVGTTIPPNFSQPLSNPCERRFLVDPNGTILKVQSFGYCPQ